MSSNENNGNSGIPQRRASITEYFRPAQPTQQYPGPITAAAAQANHRRRMSHSGGLTGTSPNPAWFGSFGRRGSVSSISSTASSPIVADEDEKSPVEPSSSSSGGSFARRLSFGARALRDVKRTMSFGTVGEGEPEHRHEEQHGSSMPPPPAPVVVPKRSNGPDEQQERILKGDYYF